jgi:alpha-D-ribose 1-methylphosphonate 5-phosphate C-P lyase
LRSERASSFFISTFFIAICEEIQRWMAIFQKRIRVKEQMLRNRSVLVFQITQRYKLGDAESAE